MGRRSSRSSKGGRSPGSSSSKSSSSKSSSSKSSSGSSSSSKSSSSKSSSSKSSSGSSSSKSSSSGRSPGSSSSHSSKGSSSPSSSKSSSKSSSSKSSSSPSPSSSQSSSSPSPSSSQSSSSPSPSSSQSSSSPSNTIQNIINRQNQTTLENIEQTKYVNAIRSGDVNLATSLLNQKTAGGYQGPNTVNIKKFLTERGYDITKPETIPNSVFKPEKQLQARAQARTLGTMGDLRLRANTYPKNNVSANNFFGVNNAQKFKANDPLEFMGPTNKKKIENFTLMDKQPLSLTSFATDKFGTDMKTGETVRLKTVGETTTPEMQFFGQFIQGSRNTFDSYGNLLTNTGNFLTGKPQQELARPPVQDQFFGAVIDSAKNTFEGKSDDRAKDPLGDFFGVQQKRIDTMGPGQVSGELFTEALIWATPIGAIGKVPKIAKSFFSPTVKTIKKSDNFTPGADFMKLEGKTKNVSWSDQLGAFFGPKGPKSKAPISAPFISSSVSLGKGTTKGKGKKPGSNFFKGSSGSGKKPGNFFDDAPKTTKTNTGLELIVKTLPKTKLKPKPFKSYPLPLGKSLAKQLAKEKAILKQSQKQFFKQMPKVKQKPKLKTKQQQQFFKPIPLVTPKVKQKQKLKQSQQFFKPIPKVVPILKPKLKQKQKPKIPMVGVVTPFFPPTAKTTGMFLPPLPFFTARGVRSRKARGPRKARSSFTAWNVNKKQVGSFLKGPSYKKSKSDNVFRDLDRRTKKAKKEKDYDYLDFF